MLPTSSGHCVCMQVPRRGSATTRMSPNDCDSPPREVSLVVEAASWRCEIPPSYWDCNMPRGCPGSTGVVDTDDVAPRPHPTARAAATGRRASHTVVTGGLWMLAPRSAARGQRAVGVRPSPMSCRDSDSAASAGTGRQDERLVLIGVIVRLGLETVRRMSCLHGRCRYRRCHTETAFLPHESRQSTGGQAHTVVAGGLGC